MPELLRQLPPFVCRRLDPLRGPAAVAKRRSGKPQARAARYEAFRLNRTHKNRSRELQGPLSTTKSLYDTGGLREKSPHRFAIDSPWPCAHLNPFQIPLTAEKTGPKIVPYAQNCTS